MEQAKIAAAKAAIKYLPENGFIGVGTGTTSNYFIEELAKLKPQIKGVVASSVATAQKLEQAKIPVFELSAIDELSVYIDSADSFNNFKQLIKGGGGALTREKILACSSKKFICIVDDSKRVDVLGNFPVAVEVIPMARSYVAREIVKLGGQPKYRENFVTDNANIILDIYGWQIEKPLELESSLNQIAGLVCNGIFAQRPADKIIIGSADGVTEL